MSDIDPEALSRADIADQRADVAEHRADVAEHRADVAERRADSAETQSMAQDLRITAQVVNVETGETNLVEARAALESVASQITTLRETLQTVYLSRSELEEKFADRREVTRRRRASLIVLAVALFTFIQAQDLHVEYCGPGHRVERMVDVFLDSPLPRETLSDRMREVGRSPVSPLCDITFPTHRHGDAEHNPTARPSGFMIYGTAVLAAYVWYRRT